MLLSEFSTNRPSKPPSHSVIQPLTLIRDEEAVRLVRGGGQPAGDVDRSAGRDGRVDVAEVTELGGVPLAFRAVLVANLHRTSSHTV